MRRARLLLWGATAATFAVLVSIAPAGIPDGRLAGYTPAEIALWAADPQARARASGPVFLLDMLFPALLASSMLLLLARGWRWGLPLAYAALDYAENLLLRAFYAGFETGVALSPAASVLTQAKWAVLAAAAALIIWPSVARLGRAGTAR